MEIKLSDYDIQSFAKEGIASEVRRIFSNSYSGSHGYKIQEAVTKAIKESEAVIAEAIKVAVEESCKTQVFKQAVHEEIIKALGKSFIGEFNAVIKSAARQAAQEEIVKQKLIKAMEEVK